MLFQCAWASIGSMVTKTTGRGGFCRSRCPSRPVWDRKKELYDREAGSLVKCCSWRLTLFLAFIPIVCLNFANTSGNHQKDVSRQSIVLRYTLHVLEMLPIIFHGIRPSIRFLQGASAFGWRVSWKPSQLTETSRTIAVLLPLLILTRVTGYYYFNYYYDYNLDSVTYFCCKQAIIKWRLLGLCRNLHPMSTLLMQNVMRISENSLCFHILVANIAKAASSMNEANITTDCPVKRQHRHKSIIFTRRSGL